MKGHWAEVLVPLGVVLAFWAIFFILVVFFP